MPVNTKTVSGRRELHFDTLDDLLDEADRLADIKVKTLGNWSLAQIFTHLAAGVRSTMDGSTLKPPLPMRMMLPLVRPFMKKKFIYGGLPAGFKIPPAAQAQFLPKDDVETQSALDDLHAAVDRLKSAEQLAAHPLLGEITKEECVQFQLRHGEMHLSFVRPVSD